MIISATNQRTGKGIDARVRKGIREFFALMFLVAVVVVGMWFWSWK